MLTEDGVEDVRDPVGLCGISKRYFDTLFETRTGRYKRVLNLIHPIISAADNEILTAPILKEELFQDLTQMHPDKSPGPDGFNPDFCQNFWAVCGEDIFFKAKVGLDRGFFPDTLNDTYICLVPKCANPNSMKDLRPFLYAMQPIKLFLKSLLID